MQPLFASLRQETDAEEVGVKYVIAPIYISKCKKLPKIYISKCKKMPKNYILKCKNELMIICNCLILFANDDKMLLSGVVGNVLSIRLLYNCIL